MFPGVAEGAPAGVDLFGLEIGDKLSGVIFDGLVIGAIILVSLAAIREGGKFLRHWLSEAIKRERDRDNDSY